MAGQPTPKLTRVDPLEQTDQQTRGTILKYDVAHDAVLEMPAGAQVMSVHWQAPHVRLWVLADPAVPKVRRRVQMLSTGGQIVGDGWEFCGTAVAPMDLVFHVFLEMV